MSEQFRELGAPPPLPSKDKMVAQMRAHVASYKTLSPHRRNCLAMCDRIKELEVKIAHLNKVIDADDKRIEALEKGRD